MLAVAVDVGTAERRKRRARDLDAVDIGDEDEAVGAQPDRQRCRGVIGVDVERAFGERRDDRHPAVREQLPEAVRCGGEGDTDTAELRDELGFEPELVTEDRHGARPDRVAQLLVLGAHRFADDR